MWIWLNNSKKKMDCIGFANWCPKAEEAHNCISVLYGICLYVICINKIIFFKKGFNMHLFPHRKGDVSNQLPGFNKPTESCIWKGPSKTTGPIPYLRADTSLTQKASARDWIQRQGSLEREVKSPSGSLYNLTLGVCVLRGELLWRTWIFTVKYVCARLMDTDERHKYMQLSLHTAGTALSESRAWLKHALFCKENVDLLFFFPFILSWMS